MPKINQTVVENIPIPLPKLQIQHEITARIGAERRAVDSCKTLIAAYEDKIKKVIDRVWKE
jgi:restriction endonuclease S subunit